MKPQKIGEIIERLIYIKDSYHLMDSNDIEAINNACNILSKHFNRMDDTNKLLYEFYTSTSFYHEDIIDILEENNIEINEDNINTIINYPGLRKHIKEKNYVVYKSALEYAINDCKRNNKF